MAAIPDPVHQTVAAIFKSYEDRSEDGNRPHLGASLIGHSCARYLWLTFRWAGAEQFAGRLLRLFDTGQREEARLIEDLRRIGVQVFDRQPDGRQFKVEACGGHFGGSMDAAGQGFPEAPHAWHVIEFKTSNTKAFKDLQKNGVQSAKPMHFAQMQIYMHLTGMERAAYLCVSKETDDIHFERIEHDEAEADRLIARAERIIFAAEPPVKLSEDPAWYECKFCHFHAHCHGTAAPAATCRSCAHVTPERAGNGRWSCAHHDRDLSIDEQRAGCDQHRVIPILLANWAEQTDVVDGAVLYRNKITGNKFLNGPRPEGYSSDEIHACADKGALGEPELKAFRDEFDGEVVA